MAVLERPCSLEVIEELQVNFVDNFRLDTQLKTLKHPDKLFTVNQFDWISTVSNCLALGIHCEASRCEQNPLVSLTDERSTKVSDHCGPYRALVTLALK